MCGETCTSCTHQRIFPDGTRGRNGSRVSTDVRATGVAGAPLGALPALFRDEPGLTRALGDPTARLAVVEVARPISIAALATLSSRRPLVVACPTGTDAGQLYDDLAQFLPADEVVLFPGVGDAAVRAGQPERGDDGPAAGGAVAPPRPRALPGRSWSPACARCCSSSAPDATDDRADHRAPAAPSSTPTSSATASSQFGYRREELVEHRGEVARRGAIVDIFPSTADAPIRIDLWGDEVDRLTEFGVNDQRCTDDLDEVVHLPGPRADADRRRASAGRTARRPPSRGAASSGSGWPRARSSTAWRAGCRGSSTTSSCSPTCCPPPRKVLLVEPRRMRDRADDLLAEEDDLARSARQHVGPRPRQVVPPPARRARPAARRRLRPCGPIEHARPSRPTHRSSKRQRMGPGGRRRRGPRRPPARSLGRQVPRGRRRRRHRFGATPRRACCSTAASTSRWSARRADLTRPAATSSSRRCTAAARARARRWRWSPRPTSPAAAAPTARPDRASARAPASSKTSSRATTSCTTSTASATTRAW